MLGGVKRQSSKSQDVDMTEDGEDDGCNEKRKPKKKAKRTPKEIASLGPPVLQVCNLQFVVTVGQSCYSSTNLQVAKPHNSCKNETTVKGSYTALGNSVGKQMGTVQKLLVISCECARVP